VSTETKEDQSSRLTVGCPASKAICFLAVRSSTKLAKVKVGAA
jgi:hypothetical protein